MCNSELTFIDDVFLTLNFISYFYIPRARRTLEAFRVNTNAGPT